MFLVRAPGRCLNSQPGRPRYSTGLEMHPKSSFPSFSSVQVVAGLASHRPSPGETMKTQPQNWAVLLALLLGLQATPAQPLRTVQVRTANGVLEGVISADGIGAHVQGHSLRRTAGRSAALETAATGAILDRCAEGRGLWTAPHAGPHFQRHGFPRQRAQRGLPVSEHLDAGTSFARQTAGDGLDLWRRLRRGLHFRSRARTAGTWRRKA